MGHTIFHHAIPQETGCSFDLNGLPRWEWNVLFLGEGGGGGKLASVLSQPKQVTQ